MELNLLNEQGQIISAVDSPDIVFGRDYNEALVHQVITAYQANARRGTRKQKDRADVHHTTKKPWRQKGTGRARAGMSSSPIWRGGGKAFPNSPDENFEQKINKKMYKACMCSILSQLTREGRLSVIENFLIDELKTKLVSQKIKNIGLSSALIITDFLEEKVLLASRNLSGILIVEPRHADPLSLVSYKNTLITKQALVKVGEMFS